MTETNEYRCNNCKFLRKYVADNGSWMFICEAEEPDEVENGLFLVKAVDIDEYCALECLNFRRK